MYHTHLLSLSNDEAFQTVQLLMNRPMITLWLQKADAISGQVIHFELDYAALREEGKKGTVQEQCLSAH